ncbi:hypothetical protein JJB11_16405 [Ramlibacter ginsenosidimutans]|uniref:Uncharacterized protein n=1 Tax=Ramlibacter ginsenosidimutans TaxID=502333 RepID=A0A934WNL3_9BURK|nr:hypothetical protein [Ramlibacter ginsenosidimutans]MBK6007683.1 hypothetical protein [Ramlibacter ginsenosidimutans]
MSTETSIGPEDDLGGNENHGNADGCGNKTLGDKVQQAREPAAGAGGVLDDAGAQVPAGVPGARPRPGIAKGPASYPDGPNVEDSPWELEAARGHLPKDPNR